MDIGPDTLCLDISNMPDVVRNRLQALQDRLEISFDNAFGLEIAIYDLMQRLKYNDPIVQQNHGSPTYEGFASTITGAKREKLLVYIEETRQAGIYLI